MERFTRCWLVTNSASGSNRADAVSNLRRSLETRGIAIEKSIEFPDQELPTPAELTAANHPLLVVFTGDGSANAAISALEGWGGAVLFIPGGTKNLLGQRLHRDCEPEVIVEQVAKGAARRVRPNVCRSDHGLGLAEILVGPGTCWSAVREATRDLDVAAIAGQTLEAIDTTAEGPPVIAASPRLGRGEGYQLVEITPGEFGLQLDGFYADTATDYARQGWAVLRRRFREGPHDLMGLADSIELRSADGSALDLLLDGEPFEGKARETIRIEPCPVDLLATAHSE